MTAPNAKFVLEDNTPRSSKTTINIAGFHVHLYGVDDLTPEQAKDTTVVFHVHGRTRTYMDAEDVAHQVLSQLRQRPEMKKGVVFATFDNRNHGVRAVSFVLRVILGVFISVVLLASNLFAYSARLEGDDGLTLKNTGNT
jgi:hypothetical protein